MASPRSTPFIASWDTDDLLDATAPLELVAARTSPARPARPSRAPSAVGPSRRAWSVIGISGLLAGGALLWATAGGEPRAPEVERVARVAPPPVRAELQPIAARLDATPPDITLAAAEPPSPPPRAQTRPQPRGELAAALLERRRQLSESGNAAADVDAVADIRFDPSRRSARVVYRVADSATEVVEYWAVRDGRWQTIN